MKKFIPELVALILMLGGYAFAVDSVEIEIDGRLSTYYFGKPAECQEYPLVVLVEGSYVASKGPCSACRLYDAFAEDMLNAGLGLLVLERRGITKQGINKKEFHEFNTPSKRLDDHIRLISYLYEVAPKGWNREIVFVGGSEGGAIAIKLAHHFSADACVAVVGCSDQPFKERIWEEIQEIRSSGSLKDRIISWWCELPQDRFVYERRCELMKRNPDPKQWWFGQTYRYWADALEQSESAEFLQLNCPILVVSGTEDVEYRSTCRLIERASLNNPNVTHLPISGMGHDALNPKWRIRESVIGFITKICRETPHIEDSPSS